MGVLVPVSAERLCLSFSWRSTIHASVDSPVRVARHCSLTGGGARTVCGVDARPVVHGVVGRSELLLAAWPPPVHSKNADRCPDCASRLGLNGRQRAGHNHWQDLQDSEAN